VSRGFGDFFEKFYHVKAAERGGGERRADRRGKRWLFGGKRR